MKRLIFGLVFMLLSVQMTAQYENRIVQVDELVWFGLDCSKLKLIGFTESSEEVADKYFMQLNTVVVQETRKYDFARFFQKSKVTHDLAWISELNDKTDPSELKAYANQKISVHELAAHIEAYNIEGEGVGLVFVLENFNKIEELGTMWVVFFDIESKQILLTKNMSAKPQGIGYRNYWVRTVYDVLREIGDQYKKWIK